MREKFMDGISEIRNTSNNSENQIKKYNLKILKISNKSKTKVILEGALGLKEERINQLIDSEDYTIEGLEFKKASKILRALYDIGTISIIVS